MQLACARATRSRVTQQRAQPLTPEAPPIQEVSVGCGQEVWFNPQTSSSLALALLLAMNLGKVSEEEKVKISRKYFVGGFFLLPLLWLVNSVWFFKEAFKKNGNRLIRKYVAGSMLGTVIWIGIVVIWVTVYQTQRPNWGAFGDYISLTVPYGRR